MMNSILFSIITLIIITLLAWKPRVKLSAGTKKVPVVEGGLPFIGHGISFSKDIIGFVRKARNKYGDVFRIKIFRKDIIVVCDHKMKEQFFKATEDKMSLYDVLDDLYFGDAFSDDPSSLPLIIKMVKNTIKIQFEEFSQKIMNQAQKMIIRLQQRCNKEPIQFADEMIRFVALTSACCFLEMDLTEEFYDDLMKFTHLLNKIVVLTYFFPKWFLKLTTNAFLRRHRMKLINALFPEIQKYRKDLTKKNSLVFRGTVDYIDKDTGFHLTDKQIGEIVICLLYVSAENTALGLTAAMIDIASNKKYWNAIKEESKKYLENWNIRSLFASSIIDACVMESARMNTHIFALDRKPKNKEACLGEYYVGDTDCIAICEPMMMVYECAQFKNPQVYNPDRFIGENTEPKTSQNILTWGAGVHLCPGKTFAIYEIKIAMALITNNFEIFELTNLGSLDYFSLSAFAGRKFKIILKSLPESELIKIKPP